jgi:hypothetical protein
MSHDKIFLRSLYQIAHYRRSFFLEAVFFFSHVYQSMATSRISLLFAFGGLVLLSLLDPTEAVDYCNETADCPEGPDACQLYVCDDGICDLEREVGCCLSDEDCAMHEDDLNGCTLETCNVTSMVCLHEPIEDCTRCGTAMNQTSEEADFFCSMVSFEELMELNTTDEISVITSCVEDYCNDLGACDVQPVTDRLVLCDYVPWFIYYYGEDDINETYRTSCVQGVCIPWTGLCEPMEVEGEIDWSDRNRLTSFSRLHTM